MKEIKFRVWEKEQKRMFAVYEFNEDHVAEDSIHPRKVCILMQYTGLKDKNGKEIYEGDIVRLGNYPFTKDIEKVEWDNSLCGFSPFAKLLCPLYEDDDVGEVRPEASFCEVIGNIYENPELREEE